MILFFLWREAGRRPGALVSNKLSLAAAGGLDPRAVERSLKRIRDAGFIDILEWNRESGAITVVVWHPAPDKREPRPTSQLELPFDAGVDNGAHGCPTGVDNGAHGCPTGVDNGAHGCPSPLPSRAKGEQGEPHPRQSDSEFEFEFEFDVVISLSEDQRQPILATAVTIGKAYWPESTPPDDALLLIYSAAVLAHSRMTVEWATEGLAAARRSCTKNPAGHLRAVLTAKLWEGGTCRREQSQEYFAALLRAVKPAAKHFADREIAQRKAASDREKERAVAAEAAATERARAGGKLEFPPGRLGKIMERTVSHLPEKKNED
jgi:hypothetical protein